VPKSASSRERAARAVPRVESLEDRTVPSTLEVGAGEKYTTITSAMNAANPGDTVLVDPGTYTEQVFITKDRIKLIGVNQQAIIQAPAALAPNTFALGDVKGAEHVTIENLTVEGPYAGGFTNVGGFLLGLHAGIFVENGGSAEIEHNHVTQIADQTLNNTTRDGFAILIGSQSNVLNTTGSAVVIDNVIDNYQSAGIDVTEVGSSALIAGNTIQGLSAAQSGQVLQQLGIVVGDGAKAVVFDNEVSSNLGGNGLGIYLFHPGTDVTLINNEFNNNSYGIYAFDAHDDFIAYNQANADAFTGITLSQSSNLQVVGNQADHNGLEGIVLFGTTGSSIRGNESNNNGIGIFVDANSTGNTFDHNRAFGNAFLDLDDLSTGSGTAGTANTWNDNHGKTDNKGGGLFAG
jgi:parallel beta-helix repeat protein